MAQEIQRMLDTFQRATLDQVRRGLVWYPEALATIDQARQRTTSRIAAAVATSILSPGTRWERLLTVLPQWFADPDSALLGYTRARAKARRALAVVDGLGSIPAVLRADTSPKTYWFALALLGVLDAVVLDRWMLRIVGDPDRIRPKRYTQLAGLLCRAAENVGLNPRDFQAVLWLVEREGPVNKT